MMTLHLADGEPGVVMTVRAAGHGRIHIDRTETTEE
jgi:hypothetical protein